MEENQTFETDLIHAIFKLVWSRRALERQLLKGTEALDGEVQVGAEHRRRIVRRQLWIHCFDNCDAANANTLKLSCELLRNFVTEAVQRAAAIAEAEGTDKIEATHLERILPQLLLDF